MSARQRKRLRTHARKLEQLFQVGEYLKYKYPDTVIARVSSHGFILNVGTRIWMKEKPRTVYFQLFAFMLCKRMSYRRLLDVADSMVINALSCCDRSREAAGV